MRTLDDDDLKIYQLTAFSDMQQHFNILHKCVVFLLPIKFAIRCFRRGHQNIVGNQEI